MGWRMDAFGAPFAMGDAAVLAGHARAAGLQGVRVEGEVRFESIRDQVATDRACAWTQGGVLDAEQFTRLAADSETALAPFRDAVGRVRFTMPALVILADKPA